MSSRPLGAALTCGVTVQPALPPVQQLPDLQHLLAVYSVTCLEMLHVYWHQLYCIADARFLMHAKMTMHGYYSKAQCNVCGVTSLVWGVWFCKVPGVQLRASLLFWGRCPCCFQASAGCSPSAAPSFCCPPHVGAHTTPERWHKPFTTLL